LIVVGGPQIPKHDPQFFKNFPQFDLAVHGEGEIAFREILSRYPTRDWSGIPNLQTWDQLPTPAVRSVVLEEIPSPILSGFYDDIIKKYPAETLWQVTIETMRGCPYQCGFCDMGDTYWTRLKKFNTDRIKKEIDWLSDNKIEYVSVCDSNWGMFETDFEITAYLVEKKKATGFPKHWDITVAKSNSERNLRIALLDKQSRTHLFKGVTFAVQSFHPPTLEATRRFNLAEDELKKYLGEYKKHDIPTYSELIWPLPEETYESLKNGIQKLISLGQEDFLMVHPLVLTPNAFLASPNTREKYGLQSRVVPLDTYYLNVGGVTGYVVEKTEAVIETRSASREDVMKGFMFSYVLITFFYYGWAHYLAKMICAEKNIQEIDFFESLQQWILKNPESLFAQEYRHTQASIADTLYKGDFWGRRVLGDNDILWEYKSASSVVFQKNRERVKSELYDFMRDSFGSGYDEVVELNLAMCCDYNKAYPVTVKTNPQVAQRMFGIDSDHLEIYREGLPFNEKTEREFMHLAYHYQRKNRFWRNRVRSVGTVEEGSYVHNS
jgi:putative methyltransferase